MHSKFVLIGLIVLCAASQGCVRRRMTVRSNPPGATVYIDDQEIGETPASTSFTYYGTRKIQLVKDGFETITVKQKFKTPWYQIPPIDFFSENLIPYEFRDERIVDIEMEPQRLVPTPELLSRANGLRQSTQAGYTVGPPPDVTAPMPSPQVEELPPTQPTPANETFPPWQSYP